MVDLSFCCLENGLNGNGFTCEALQQAGCSGKRKPNQQPVQGPPRHVKRRWRSQPQTEAVEAIQQIAGKSLPQAHTKSRDEIRRTVLVRQQVSHSPGGEDSENKSNPMVCFTHISPDCASKPRRESGITIRPLPLAATKRLPLFRLTQKHPQARQTWSADDPATHAVSRLR
jgi:hypothetical protein